MKRRFDMKKSVLPEQEQQEELVVEEPQQKKGHIFVVATFFAKSTHTYIYINIITTKPFSYKIFMLDEMTSVPKTSKHCVVFFHFMLLYFFA